MMRLLLLHTETDTRNTYSEDVVTTYLGILLERLEGPEP